MVEPRLNREANPLHEKKMYPVPAPRLAPALLIRYWKGYVWVSSSSSTKNWQEFERNMTPTKQLVFSNSLFFIQLSKFDSNLICEIFDHLQHNAVVRYQHHPYPRSPLRITSNRGSHVATLRIGNFTVFPRFHTMFSFTVRLEVNLKCINRTYAVCFMR